MCHCRTRLRIQHLVEKEKLVLAVEQEILRVHGRAERAVANQVIYWNVFYRNNIVKIITNIFSINFRYNLK